MTLLDALVTSVIAADLRPLETLRANVMRASLTAGGDVTQEDRARRVIRLARRGPLRGLVNTLLDRPIQDSALPLRKSTATVADLDAQLEIPVLSALCSRLNVSDSAVGIIWPYLTNSLPQRRVEAYCALACLCLRAYEGERSG